MRSDRRKERQAQTQAQIDVRTIQVDVEPAALRAENERLRDLCATYQRDAEVSTAQADRLRDTLAIVRAEHQRTREALAAAKAERDRLENVVAEQNTLIDGYGREASTAARMVEQLYDDLDERFAESDHKAAKHWRRSREMQARAERAESERDDLLHEVADLRSERVLGQADYIDAQKKSLRNAERVVERAESALADLKRRITALANEWDGGRLRDETDRPIAPRLRALLNQAEVTDRDRLEVTDRDRLIEHHAAEATRSLYERKQAEARLAAVRALADEWRVSGFDIEADQLDAALAFEAGERDE